MEDKRNIIITGANSGIGLACIECFLSNGDNVIGLVRSEKDSIIKELLSFKSSGKLDIYYLDLEDSLDLRNNFTKIIKQYDKIDVLVNNAGKLINGLVQMTSKDKFSELLNLNFFAPLELIQIVTKKMMRAKKGNIINISSTSAEDCNFGRSAYSSSKAALESLTKTLAYELGSFNIRANCVLPGLTDTKLMRNNTQKEVLAEVLKEIALGRIAHPKEIAEFVYFLSSDKASYITAQTIRIDGGMGKK